MKIGVRLAVVLTALLCLGTAGYAGQLWWAKRIAEATYEVMAAEQNEPEGPPYDMWDLGTLIRAWRSTPAFGLWNPGAHGYVYADGLEYRMLYTLWLPRQAYPELLRRVTSWNLPADPDAWEAWIKAHPDPVWDTNQKRLVEPKPKTVAPSRWAVHLAVILTALLCLATAGYAGQMWWAKRMAQQEWDRWRSEGYSPGAWGIGNLISEWRDTPPFGHRSHPPKYSFVDGWFLRALQELGRPIA